MLSAFLGGLNDDIQDLSQDAAFLGGLQLDCLDRAVCKLFSLARDAPWLKGKSVKGECGADKYK